MPVVLSDRDAIAIHSELEFLHNTLDAYRAPGGFKDFEMGKLRRLMARLKPEIQEPRQLFSVISARSAGAEVDTEAASTP